MTDDQQRAKIEALRARRTQPSSTEPDAQTRRRRPHPAGRARIVTAGVAASGFFMLATAMAISRPAAAPSLIVDSPVSDPVSQPATQPVTPISLDSSIVVVVPLPVARTVPSPTASAGPNDPVPPTRPPQIVPTPLQQTVPPPVAVPVAATAPRRATTNPAPAPASAATTKTSGR